MTGRRMLWTVNRRLCMMIMLLFRPYDQKNPFLAPVSVNRELHKGGDRSCMHIELDITQAKLR